MIPVFEPIIGEDELQAVTAALRSGEISGSFGETIPRFEQAFADYCECKYGVAVSSGTTALHLAVAAAGIKHEDEVLVSSSTNIASALAIYHNGAVPVAVDSEEVTWNLNVDLIESLITSRTRGIIPVHLFGHPADMDRIVKIAERYKLTVIEDCAQSHGAKLNGKMTGSFGDMGCFSFYANKIITTGEGGMVVTNDERLAERLRLLRNLAFTKPRFKHEYAGYNFRMTGYQAAMGLAQFKKIDFFIAERRRVAHTYNHYLRDIPGLQLPTELPGAFNVYWMYSIKVKPEFGMARDRLVEHLKCAGIDTRTFFYPINLQPCFQNTPGFKKISNPVAERLWETGLYLPSSAVLTEDTIIFIANSIKRAQEQNS